ncbi:MAG: hypothetical protein ABMB14_11670, partial [Myxococcota bacterium]
TDPTASLSGWHAGGAGSIGLLVDLAPGSRWFGRWKVSATPIETWTAPARTAAGEWPAPSPRGVPVPGSILVSTDADGRSWIADQGAVERVGEGDGDLVAAIRVRTDPRARVDLLVHPSAAPTVEALLALCRRASAGRAGLRCAVVDGPVSDWTILANRPLSPSGGIPVEFEVEEVPDYEALEFD